MKQYKIKRWFIGGLLLVFIFFIVGISIIKAQEGNNQARLQDPELDLLYQFSVHSVRLEQAIRVYKENIQNIGTPLGVSEDRFDQLLITLNARNLNEAQKEANSLSADIEKYLIPIVKSEKSLDPANGDALLTNTIKQETSTMMKLLEEFEPKIPTFKSRILSQDKKNLFDMLIKKLWAREILYDVFSDEDLYYGREKAYAMHEELAYLSNYFTNLRLNMMTVLEKNNIGTRDGIPFFDIKHLLDENLSVLGTQPEIGGIAVRLHSIQQKLDAIPEQKLSGLEGDLDNDGKVDIFDLVIVAKNFGKKIQ